MAVTDEKAVEQYQLREALIKRARAEQQAQPNFRIPIELDVSGALCVVGQLQLSLRHPANDGPSAMVARSLIVGIIAAMRSAGLEATAEFADMGDRPEWDS